MAETPSTMLELGTKAPDFELKDPQGRTWRRFDFAGRPLLVMFLSNHCPFVKHVQRRLAEVTADFVERGIGVIGIMANDYQAYPDDAPARMAEEVERLGYRFPYVVDETQDVAKAYRAACTPDFFLFDADHGLVYRGQFDGARPSLDTPVTGEDLSVAAEAVLAGKAPDPQAQAPSVGCNIKWKPDNAPGYAR
jgi:peroxiredoxin